MPAGLSLLRFRTTGSIRQGLSVILQVILKLVQNAHLAHPPPAEKDQDAPGHGQVVLEDLAATVEVRRTLNREVEVAFIHRGVQIIHLSFSTSFIDIRSQRVKRFGRMR